MPPRSFFHIFIKYRQSLWQDLEKKLHFIHSQTDSMHTLNSTSVLRQKKKKKKSYDCLSFNTPHPPTHLPHSGAILQTAAAAEP